MSGPVLDPLEQSVKQFRREMEVSKALHHTWLKLLAMERLTQDLLHLQQPPIAQPSVGQRLFTGITEMLRFVQVRSERTGVEQVPSVVDGVFYVILEDGSVYDVNHDESRKEQTR